MLHTKALAFALASTAAIAYIICALVVAVAPDTAASLYGAMAHMKGAELQSITFGSFILGIIQVIVYTYLAGWVFGAIYNKRTK